MKGLKDILAATAPILGILAIFGGGWIIQHVGDIDLFAVFKAIIIPFTMGYGSGYGYSYWRSRKK